MNLPCQLSRFLKPRLPQTLPSGGRGPHQGCRELSRVGFIWNRGHHTVRSTKIKEVMPDFEAIAMPAMRLKPNPPMKGLWVQMWRHHSVCGFAPTFGLLSSSCEAWSATDLQRAWWSGMEGTGEVWRLDAKSLKSSCFGTVPFCLDHLLGMLVVSLEFGRPPRTCRRVCLPKWISLGETGRGTVDLEAWLEVVLVPTASQDAPEVLPCLDDWPIDRGRNSTCHHDHSACAGGCRFVYSKRCNVINPRINHPLNHHCMDGINNPHTVCLWHWVSDIAETTDGWPEVASPVFYRAVKDLEQQDESMHSKILIRTWSLQSWTLTVTDITSLLECPGSLAGTSDIKWVGQTFVLVFMGISEISDTLAMGQNLRLGYEFRSCLVASHSIIFHFLQFQYFDQDPHRFHTPNLRRFYQRYWHCALTPGGPWTSQGSDNRPRVMRDMLSQDGRLQFEETPCDWEGQMGLFQKGDTWMLHVISISKGNMSFKHI